MTENWRPVVGYEDYYEVSDLGRVRSLDRFIKRRDGATQFCRGQLLRAATAGQNAYPAVGLHRKGSASTRTIHSLVLAAFIGPKPAGLQTRHLNGDHTDNRLSNLQYGTAKENAADKFRHGTFRTRLTGLTHCVRGGHEFTPENTARGKDGYRRCLACRRVRDRDDKRKIPVLKREARAQLLAAIEVPA